MQLDVLVRSYIEEEWWTALTPSLCHLIQDPMTCSIQWKCARPWWATNVFHAVFLLMMETEETVSQPAKAWIIGSASDLCGPGDVAISWAAMHRKWSPVPNASQILHSPNVCAVAIDRTTTSVSTILIIILLYPQLNASDTWTMILVSTSSCKHGARFWVFLSGLHTTPCPSMTTSSHLSLEINWSFNKQNSWVLFSLCLKNWCQFLGKGLEADLHRHTSP